MVVCGWSSATLVPLSSWWHERADSGVDGEAYLQNGHRLPDLERAHGAQRGGTVHAALRVINPDTRGARTRCGLECISVAAQNRWRGGQDGGTRRRCTNTLPVDEASDER